MSRKNATMTRQTVVDNVYLYVFRDKDAKHEDAITVIVQNNQALFIDTAYPEYAAQVRADLEKNGIKPQIVILSHYHPDHAAGCSVLTDCEIYAHKFYESNYGNCQIWMPQYTYVKPKYLIEDGDTMDFGTFTLEFLHAPGHCKCAIITCITEKIIHTNDLIMITWDRKNTIPLVADGGSFEDHISSLELIKKLDPETILAPHGNIINSKDEIKDHIEDRLFYLKKLLTSKGDLPLQACLKKNISKYDHLELHDHNLIRLL